jgi:ribonuclease D
VNYVVAGEIIVIMLNMASLAPQDRAEQVELCEGDLTESAFAALQQCDVLAWDTETTGLDWKRDRLGLIQISSPRYGTALVQRPGPTSVRVIELLSRSSIAKVFHHAPFDLRFMRTGLGVRAENVWCTKVAAKILAPYGEASANSLAPLVKSRLGVTLDKGSVRTSDWTSGSLSAAQVNYAARDVAFLLPLLNELGKSLDKAGLWELYANCCSHLPWRAELEVAEMGDVFAY